jgi:hypothetical protein
MHTTKAQTPLVPFVVNLLWICRKIVDLLWICCGFVAQLFDLLWTSRKPYSTVPICCEFAVQLVVQQIEQVEFELKDSQMVDFKAAQTDNKQHAV